MNQDDEIAKRKTNVSNAIVFTALFSAIISVSCFFQIPLPFTPLPIVLQDMMSFLAGLLLGPIFGSISVLIFLLLGIIGLPVFSGKAGIQVILKGPTGGFLIGYLVAAFVGGLFLYFVLNSKKDHSQAKQWIMICIAVVLSNFVMFSIGIFCFMKVVQTDLKSALMAALVPFIPGNVIKMILLVFLTKKFRPIIRNYIEK